ncbi:acyltransferase family protein [Listeria booriae]|uniref:acyltransferase family protein n=1 Tax=Listeria booriae TaxID=1552123 RepID=UPI00162591D6|nr:acyltransferase family protein [Listeria booriae]MBC1245433.1 acetyltransferase [Listeria booriae]MBC1286857.1 acetyltransferase [Listeria booriae]MBC2364776.1 acetyltransferase [Listeria booriae]
MERSARHKRKYVPSIDGLRALAVIAVIAYHLSFGWASGGFLGVDIFFVLSGYLITNILLTEWENNERIDLKKFWIGRFRRLIPAVYLMIVVVVVFAVIFNRPLLATLRGDATASFLYVSNWWFIFHNVSYFDSFGMASPLKNLWSLAIEEQFYLIWPLFLFGALKFIKKPKAILRIIIIAAILSAVWMAILYSPDGDPSRVYYGTDTRAFGLLLGGALAFVWPFTRLSPNIPLKGKLTVNIAGTVSVLIFLFCVVNLNEYDSFLYRGGMFLIAINAIVMIATIAHPASYLSKLFSFKPLRWIGTRSYGIYLWHYPIITLTTPITEVGTPNLMRAALQVAATFIIAELSYRFVETPIRKNGFIAYIKSFRFQNLLHWRGYPIGKWALTASLVLVLGFFALGMSNLIPVKSNAEGTQKTSVKTVAKAETPAATPKKETPKKEAPPDTDTTKKKATAPPKKEVAATTPDQIKYAKTVAIGDSLMIDIQPILEKAVPNIAIDGLVGRQMVDALNTATQYESYNANGNAVIIELGTNGPFALKKMEELVQMFDKASIYLVNTRVPRQWESEVNESIKKIDAEYDNVTRVDWYSLAVDHPEYFGRDGVHLTKKGVAAYVNLLTHKMANK